MQPGEPPVDDDGAVIVVDVQQQASVQALLAATEIGTPAPVRFMEADGSNHEDVLEAAVVGDTLLVVGIDGTAGRSAQILDALVRVRRLGDWRLEPAAHLDPLQVALLAGIGVGATVPQAARAANVSERSAFRSLATARDVLGVTTNVEAVAAIRALVQGVRRRPR